MKKLEGVKKDFSTFENRKLADLKSVIGGNGAIETNDQWSMATCEENCADTYFYKDGVRIGGGREMPETDCIAG